MPNLAPARLHHPQNHLLNQRIIGKPQLGQILQGDVLLEGKKRIGQLAIDGPVQSGLLFLCGIPTTC